MRLVSPERLTRSAATDGYREIDRQLVEVPGGQRFQVPTFRVPAVA